MRNAKRWLGYLVIALLVIVAVAQYLHSNQQAVVENDPTGQEITVPDGEGQQGVDDPDPGPEDPIPEPSEPEPDQSIFEDGIYTTKDDVALYIHLYHHLPDNFITKRDAEKLGWPGGSLEPYAPGMCIGGDRFGNYEGKLPKAEGRSYQECDIDTLGAKNRGAKRIVFSNDGLIYYTDDHYNTFTLLYGEVDG